MGGGEIEEKRVFEFSTIIMQIFDATNIHWLNDNLSFNNSKKLDM